MSSTSCRLEYLCNNAISMIIGLLTGIITAETFYENYIFAICGTIVVLIIGCGIWVWKPALRSKYSPSLLSGIGTGLIVGIVVSALFANKPWIFIIGIVVVIVFVIIPIGYYYKNKDTFK